MVQRGEALERPQCDAFDLYAQFIEQVRVFPASKADLEGEHQYAAGQRPGVVKQLGYVVSREHDPGRQSAAQAPLVFAAELHRIAAADLLNALHYLVHFAAVHVFCRVPGEGHCLALQAVEEVVLGKRFERRAGIVFLTNQLRQEGTDNRLTGPAWA